MYCQNHNTNNFTHSWPVRWQLSWHGMYCRKYSEVCNIFSLTGINCGHNSLSPYLCRKSRLIYSHYSILFTLYVKISGHLHTVWLTASIGSWLELDRRVSPHNECSLVHLVIITQLHHSILFPGLTIRFWAVEVLKLAFSLQRI